MLTTSQLCLMRSLSRGWEVSLVEYLLTRNGASQGEYQYLKDQGWIVEEKGRIRLTKIGRSAYSRHKKGRVF